MVVWRGGREGSELVAAAGGFGLLGVVAPRPHGGPFPGGAACAGGGGAARGGLSTYNHTLPLVTRKKKFKRLEFGRGDTSKSLVFFSPWVNKRGHDLTTLRI